MLKPPPLEASILPSEEVLGPCRRKFGKITYHNSIFSHFSPPIGSSSPSVGRFLSPPLARRLQNRKPFITNFIAVALAGLFSCCRSKFSEENVVLLKYFNSNLINTTVFSEFLLNR